MTDIKIKRYADKENLKKLVKYSKDTFANKSEINEKFYTKEQIDSMFESGSGGTGGGGSEVGDATIKINYDSTNLGSFTTNQSADAIVDIRPINKLISENYYTKEQIDTMLESGSGGGGTGGDYYTKSEIDTKLTSKANTSDLSTVATTGSYNDLLDKPTSFDVDVDLDNYYTKSEVDNLLSNIGSGTEGGNADTATKLATARTIALSGAATGTATEFDGSDNITIPVTSLDASKLTGTASVSTTGNAATADRASAANCVQSQTSDYHEIRFDWDSQVSDHVGLRVDETDMGGIVTTNRLVSAIRDQWYAAYPDGPEAHNAMWGGRDITDAFDAGTVSEHIADGTFKDIFPGDYITKQITVPRVLADDGTTVLYGGDTYTINWVIADCDYWNHTAHHVVIVPQEHIFYARMNPTDTTEGGYAGSEMFKKIIPACAKGIVNAFGADHILTFNDAITNSVDTSHASSSLPQFMGTPGWFGEWVSVQCNLMSEKMVYGAPIFSAGAMNNVMALRQMSAFRLSSNLINNATWGRVWWLRDVVSSSHFAAVYNYPGVDSVYADAFDASQEDRQMLAYPGVRPFALLV